MMVPSSIAVLLLFVAVIDAQYYFADRPYYYGGTPPYYGQTRTGAGPYYPYGQQTNYPDYGYNQQNVYGAGGFPGYSSFNRGFQSGFSNFPGYPVTSNNLPYQQAKFSPMPILSPNNYPGYGYNQNGYGAPSPLNPYSNPYISGGQFSRPPYAAPYTTMGAGVSNLGGTEGGGASCSFHQGQCVNTYSMCKGDCVREGMNCNCYPTGYKSTNPFLSKSLLRK